MTSHSRKLVTFDLETTCKAPDDAEDWRGKTGIPIACAATLNSGASLHSIWYSCRRLNVDFQMAQDKAQELVVYLEGKQAGGRVVFTWNGLGFDWPILAAASGWLERCQELALHHIDGMFTVFWEKGFPVSLKAVSEGMGVEGKTEGMDGLKAVEMWQDPKKRRDVLGYVGDDVAATMRVAKGCEVKGRIQWTSKSGNPMAVVLPGGKWPTVSEVLRTMPPGQGWMSTPIKPGTFTDWLSLEKEGDV